VSKWYEFTEFGPSFYETAAFRVVHTISIDATAEKVFETLEDPDAWPKWIPMVKRVEWTSPKPFEVGTTRTVIMKNGYRIDERFILWEQNRRMSFTVLGASVPGLTSFGEDYLLTPTATGCELQWTFALQPRGFLAQGLYLAYPAFRLALKKTLKDLKRVVERRA